MKIVATVGPSAFLVQVTEDELAKIAGFPYASSMSCRDWKCGSEIKVSDLWHALSVSRERHDDLRKMSKQLRDAATRVDTINAALAQPIIEVKT